MVPGVEIVRAWGAAVLRQYTGAERLSEELSFHHGPAACTGGTESKWISRGRQL